MILIGEAAERSGVTADTLRYYERKGLIEPARRSENGYRLFEEEVVTRLEFIRKARGFGLSLREVGDVLRRSDDGEVPCDHVRSMLAARLQQLNDRLAELRALRDAVARALEPESADPLSAPSICHIIETQEVDHTAVWPRWQSNPIDTQKGETMTIRTYSLCPDCDACPAVTVLQDGGVTIGEAPNLLTLNAGEWSELVRLIRDGVLSPTNESRPSSAPTQ